MSTDNSCAAIAVSTKLLVSTNSRCKVLSALLKISVSLHSQALRIILATNDISVHSLSCSFSTKAVAISKVSPFRLASTISISTSGLHCSTHFSAHEALS